jgi:hypothetical protein
MPFLQDFNTDTLEAWRSGDQIQVKDGYDAMFRKLVEYGSGKPSVDNGTLVYTGTGDGLLANLDMPVDGPTETWDIVATSATNFTVDGSVTGSLSDATVDVAYSNGDLSFTIIDGATPFVATDAWTLDVTAGVNDSPADEQWLIDKWDPNTFVPDDDDEFLVWHGEGDGTEAIYCGLRLVETPASQIWNWEMRCYTGFNGGADFTTQPGTSAGYFFALHENDIRFWLSLNARRYAFGAVVQGTSYHSMYQGFFLPYGSPNEYPYPICIMAEKNDQEAWNSLSTVFSGILNSVTSNGALRAVDGTWLTVSSTASTSTTYKWPNGPVLGAATSVWDNHENWDNGDNQLFPIVLITGIANPITSSTTLGELEGALIVTGFSVSPEDVITISGTDYVVFQDIARSQRDDFWALEMV